MRQEAVEQWVTAYSLTRGGPPPCDLAACAYDGGNEGSDTMFPSLLRREIIILLAAKAALLTLLYVLFFSPAHRDPVTPERLRAHLTGE
ncbi:MAG: hypothetical protein JWN16_1592 [Alphaproteobacteria bacterium]|nr:hypothetical protein [Alphaproteobacteria bacterium]